MLIGATLKEVSKRLLTQKQRLKLNISKVLPQLRSSPGLEKHFTLESKKKVFAAPTQCQLVTAQSSQALIKVLSCKSLSIVRQLFPSVDLLSQLSFLAIFSNVSSLQEFSFDKKKLLAASFSPLSP